MRIVVTGGAGFIGSNLVRRLEASGDEVVVFDNFSTGSRENLAGCHAEIIEGTILDLSALEEPIESADSVVHLAARPSVPRSIADPLASHHANATGTLNVLEAARRGSGTHVVVASSSSVYGANPAIPKSEDLVPMPLSPYAVSKLAAESYTLAYATCFGLHVLPFRFFNVYGPNQQPDHAYAAVIPAFISAALDGRPLPIFGDGLQTRDFTFVGNVTQILEETAHNTITSERPVNLAFGTRTSLLGVCDVLEDIVGHPLERAHLPSRSGDVRDSQANNDRLLELFPDSQPVSLEDGVRQTVDWFRQTF